MVTDEYCCNTQSSMEWKWNRTENQPFAFVGYFIIISYLGPQETFHSHHNIILCARFCEEISSTASQLANIRIFLWLIVNSSLFHGRR